MPHLRLVLCLTLAGLLLAGPAAADMGLTLAALSDARERGLSYSGNRPTAQVGLAWDGDSGWYGGALLTRARLDSTHDGAWLRAYGGRVVALLPGLDGEAGVQLNRFERVTRYDHAEAYAGLLGERWSLRLHHAPDDYGSGQHTLYTALDLRWPLVPGLTATGHAGALRGLGRAGAVHTAPGGPVRTDLRLGWSWQLGAAGELQLARVAASRGGPYTWADTTQRHAWVLGLSLAR